MGAHEVTSHAMSQTTHTPVRTLMGGTNTTKELSICWASVSRRAKCLLEVLILTSADSTDMLL